MQVLKETRTVDLHRPRECNYCETPIPERGVRMTFQEGPENNYVISYLWFHRSCYTTVLRGYEDES